MLERPPPPPSETRLSTPTPPAGPTLDQAIAWARERTDLDARYQGDLVSLLSSAARLLGLPPDTVVLTPAGLRASLLSRSANSYGLAEGTMRNIRSALGVVSRGMGIIDAVNTRYTPAWTARLALLSKFERAGLTGLIGFCSERGIAPEQVGDETIAAYEAWLEERTLTTRPRKVAGAVRGAWNHAATHVAGWPQQPLSVLRQRDHYVKPPTAFPAPFQANVVAFGLRLGATSLDSLYDEDADDEADDDLVSRLEPDRPCRPSTVALRESHCRWAASALVATGVPIAEVTSLSTLVTPIHRARDILRFLYRRAGNQPSAAGSHVAEVLLMIAKYHVRLPSKDVARIRKWSKPVRLEYKGMTDKNVRAIRQMMEPARFATFLALPGSLMQVARKLRPIDPKGAASIALRAVAIHLLTRIPLRLANVIGLRFDRHLQRANPPRGRISHIDIPIHEAKNSRAISMPVLKDMPDLLEEWIADYRPAIASPGCLYLFPGSGTGNCSITPQGFRDAVRETMDKYVGVRLTPHQFRHLAARIYLRAYPGHYETVRRLLGNKLLETITGHYASDDGGAAARCYDGVLEEFLRSLCRTDKKGGQRKRRLAGRKVACHGA